MITFGVTKTDDHKELRILLKTLLRHLMKKSGTDSCKKGWKNATMPHNVPGQGSNPDSSIRDKRTNHEATAPPQIYTEV